MYKTDTQMPFWLGCLCLSLVVLNQAVEGAPLMALLAMTLVPTIPHERIYLRTIKHAHQYPKGSACFTGQRDNVKKRIVNSVISEANRSPLHSHP